jgi:ubiquinol-cytochrome c reductase cytochrome c subunit
VAPNGAQPERRTGRISAHRRRRGPALLAIGALVALLAGGVQTFGAAEPLTTLAQVDVGGDDLPDERGSTAREQVIYGGEVFQANCAACHGTRLQGGPGPGVLDGGPLLETDIAFVDLTMRTGRMPIVEESVGVRTDVLPDDAREAVNAYLLEVFDLPGEIPEVGEGSAAAGQELYVRNCAACHGAAADGGISGADVRVPPLTGLDPVAIVEGTRVGPFEMPAFTASVLDDQAVDDIAAYLELANDTPRTAMGVQELDQVGEALFALGLFLLVALIVWIVARARRWSASEPEGFHGVDPFEPR